MIDVCLILEGTYPYTSGGVSTWIHQMIGKMPDIKFGILYIAPHSDPTRRSKYKIPSHVIFLKDFYLFDYTLSKTVTRKPSKKDFTLLADIYGEIINGNFLRLKPFMELFVGHNKCFATTNTMYSKEIFSILNSYYKKFAWDVSYLDFFWTWRGMHLPLLEILQTQLPPAKLYHAVSTGYAGLLATLGKIQTDAKMLLTEHGLYSHERNLEISQSTWIYEPESPRFVAQGELSFFKTWWNQYFQVMGRIAYHYADQVFTISEGNKIKQVAFGADSKKIRIVVNGVDLKILQTISRKKKNPDQPPQVALIGRVVPIKNVKIFIHAAKIIHDRLPDAQFYVIGPIDETPEYYEECRILAELIGMSPYIKFTGYADVRQYYATVDVVVLTSLSEAQPYVINEANAVSIPVVATEVGSCRELLEGRDLEDQSIGPSGIITEVENPQATADAVCRLLTDTHLYERYSKAAVIRSQKYYNLDDMISQYLNIYEKYI